MIKKLILFITIMSASFAGCNDPTTDDVSRTTFFPEFTYNGDEVIILPKGEEYAEPGVTAVELGQPIDVTSDVEGMYFGGTTLDVNAPDIYSVTYSAFNSDGFAGTRFRQVIVAPQGDLIENLEGLYVSTVGRNGPPTAQYSNLEYVIIRQTGENVYEISDAIGGYYDRGRAYGPAFAPRSTITANNIAGNDFTFGPTFGVGSFGGEANIVSMAVDPVTKTITMTTRWQADPETVYVFDVTLVQVQL